MSPLQRHAQEYTDDNIWDENVTDENLFDTPVLETNRGDVLVSSDFRYISNKEDDGTVEIDDKAKRDCRFETWGTAELKEWLKGHAVQYARRGANSELASLRKINFLPLEMKTETARLEAIEQKEK